MACSQRGRRCSSNLRSASRPSPQRITAAPNSAASSSACVCGWSVCVLCR
jgi:hypothetical protein